MTNKSKSIGLGRRILIVSLGASLGFVMLIAGILELVLVEDINWILPVCSFLMAAVGAHLVYTGTTKWPEGDSYEDVARF